MVILAKTYTQTELYSIVKAAGEFATCHSASRTKKFKEFYQTLKKEKAPIKYMEQGPDYDLLIWWKDRWNSFNQLIRKVFC